MLLSGHFFPWPTSLVLWKKMVHQEILAQLKHHVKSWTNHDDHKSQALTPFPLLCMQGRDIFNLHSRFKINQNLSGHLDLAKPGLSPDYLQTVIRSTQKQVIAKSKKTSGTWKNQYCHSIRIASVPKILVWETRKSVPKSPVLSYFPALMQALYRPEVM